MPRSTASPTSPGAAVGGTATPGLDQTRLVLVRHGESQCGVDRIVGGHLGCTGLTEEGRAQAGALRDRLARTGELSGASVFATSILSRAIETAEIISPAFAAEVAFDQRCDLCERHPGEADGIGWEELEQRYWSDGKRTLYDVLSPGGESWAAFLVRAGAALRGIAREHEGRTVVVVCHGGVVEASFRAFGNLPVEPPFRLRVDHTSLTEWRLRTDEPRWQLFRFNDAVHLLDGWDGSPARS